MGNPGRLNRGETQTSLGRARKVGEASKRGEVEAREGRKEGSKEGRKAGAFMSLSEVLLIPRQEYQQYLTGNVTECQVGKCQWGRTGGGGGRPGTSPLR